MNQRIAGFDVARALAIFGMVIVNFQIVMTADTGSPLLLGFAHLFEGRASALFVILAGIGVTFLTNKARQSSDDSLKIKSQISLIKRGLLFIVIGLLYMPVWEGDILHFYGFYFLIAAAFVRFNNNALLLISATIILIFPMLMLLFNYEQNWNLDTLAYVNIWSIDGMIRHIFFNGFHPVFPWAAFLIFGMWLGRQDLSQSAVRKRFFFRSLIIFIVVESASYFAREIFFVDVLGMTKEDAAYLFSVSIMPPLPQYIISAACTSLIVLIACLFFSERFSSSNINKWLGQTGQSSLTLYVAHVVLGMGLLDYMGKLNNQTIELTLLSALIFCICGVITSSIWFKFFKTGPLEWVFRKLAS